MLVFYWFLESWSPGEYPWDTLRIPQAVHQGYSRGYTRGNPGGYPEGHPGGCSGMAPRGYLGHPFWEIFATCSARIPPSGGEKYSCFYISSSFLLLEGRRSAEETQMTPLESTQNRPRITPDSRPESTQNQPRINPNSTQNLWGSPRGIATGRC